MTQLLNSLLMLGFLAILYLAIRKYNKEQFNNTDDTDYVVNKDLTMPFKNKNDEPYYINFDYEISKDEKLVSQFQKEQKEGANTTIKYPNRFIVKLDADDKPIWSDYKNLTGNPDSFIDNRILFGDNLYGSHIKNMDGMLNPKDANIENNGKTLKNIYDSHVLDFKDLIPKNEMINNNNNKQTAASKLSYLDNDDWKYKDESIMNGGPILDNFYAADPNTYNTPAAYE
jgi:hypothetical protein